MLIKTLPIFLLAAIAVISCSDSAVSGTESEISSGRIDASSTLQSSSGTHSSGTSTTSAISPSSSSPSIQSSSVSAKYWNQAISYGVLTDARDKKSYRTTVIGTQNWMAENLNFTAKVGESRCYDAKPANCAIYGRLYDWEAATASCPEGWHLPDTMEWGKLAKYLGGASGAGKILKASSALWKNNTGNDAFGFAALPSGSYDNDQYYDLGAAGLWWTSSDLNSTTAYYRDIVGSVNAIRTGQEAKEINLSVRCVEDGESFVSSSLAQSSGNLSSVTISSSSPEPSSSSIAILYNCGTKNYNPEKSFCDTRDLQIYDYVSINNQKWMAENLNYGTASGSWCDPNTLNYCSIYGRLYDLTTAIISCPSGWHLASNAEWTNLVEFVGGGDSAASKLKASTGWPEGQVQFTNSFGFSALPGGVRGTEILAVGTYGKWWTSTLETEYPHPDNYNAWAIYEASISMNEGIEHKSIGLSVRCIAD